MHVAVRGVLLHGVLLHGVLLHITAEPRVCLRAYTPRREWVTRLTYIWLSWCATWLSDANLGLDARFGKRLAGAVAGLGVDGVVRVPCWAATYASTGADDCGLP